MSEDKMLESFSVWWNEHGQFCRAGGGQYEETFAYEAWKACAAIKDAEIAEHNERWKDLRNVLECTQKEVASHDLTIKELQCQLVDTRATLLGLQPDFGGPIAAQMGKAVLRINEALAKSEQHNSRALEIKLLEAELRILRNFDQCEHKPTWNVVREMIVERESKLAELNKE